MIITLTGFMGCGKSSVGRRLAKLLSCSFVDLDDYIVERAGKSVADIFTEVGEKGFRVFECQCLRELLERPVEGDFVIALGGGAVTTPECVSLIRQHAVCVYLTASEETLQKRLSGDTKRPLLQGESLEQRIHRLMEQRAGIYASVADFEVATDELTPMGVAHEIFKVIN
ncbi:MAG: shikimate kinase [Bacteroidales bacterium]|nr:shikimate kinase [Bacteroidales bacterium]